MQIKCNNEDCCLSLSCWTFQKPKIDGMKERRFEVEIVKKPFDGCVDRKIDIYCDEFVDIDGINIEEVQEPFINGFEVEA